MIRTFVKKYISIIFILATFIGVFHNHNSLQQHNDCQICVIQSSIANADTPSETFYLTKLELFADAIESNLPQFFLKYHSSQLHARAPPILL